MSELSWQRERLEHNRLARAQRGDEEAFEQLTAPYRRELQLHCYRILGSVQDAEDLLQETLLAAWRGLEQFEGRSSLRTWLYTIATNRCLNALRDGARRPQAAPASPGGTRPASGAPHPTESVAEIAWLEPYPDLLLEGLIDIAPGPEARYEAKEAIALAFVSGLQHLAPRQRGVLVLRDVLGFHAEEVAEMLGTSPASVNSALQRARAAMDSRVPPGRDRLSLPLTASGNDLVTRFADAFERDDIDAVVALLTEDAVVSMPPEPEWHQGRADIGRFLRDRHLRRKPRAWRFYATAANAQPAYAYYLQDGTGWERAGVFVVGVRADGIESITRFHDGGLLDRFGLPPR
ncbi:MAG TPA: sigma-70 family RNA polymerase sigma factor [Solirubrobacteraceae bacterium]|jgi:RNA polymerase sigma-70 factor (ECF subfamily)|nr:sigma-70 family RNA polymerase sigma factor [Solirubrobacteraceae bacterium]